MDSISSRIKSFRKQKNLSQGKLGEIIGAKGTSVSNWENEVSMPEPKFIEAMAKCFGITAQELQYGNAPIIVNKPPEGTMNIPIDEYVEYLKYKAEKAEKELASAKNIEVVFESK